MNRDRYNIPWRLLTFEVSFKEFEGSGEDTKSVLFGSLTCSRAPFTDW